MRDQNLKCWIWIRIIYLKSASPHRTNLYWIDLYLQNVRFQPDPQHCHSHHFLSAVRQSLMIRLGLVAEEMFLFKCSHQIRGSGGPPTNRLQVPVKPVQIILINLELNFFLQFYKKYQKSMCTKLI